MPAVFFGHGNPLNALMKNAYTEGWANRAVNAATSRYSLHLRSLVLAGHSSNRDELAADDL